MGTIPTISVIIRCINYIHSYITPKKKWAAQPARVEHLVLEFPDFWFSRVSGGGTRAITPAHAYLQFSVPKHNIYAELYLVLFQLNVSYTIGNNFDNVDNFRNFSLSTLL